MTEPAWKSLRAVWPALLLVLTLLAVTAAAVVSAPVPERLAKTIYRENPDFPRQLYIVAQSHRSLLTGENAVDTTTVQAQIYRIGEWLIKHGGVTVLLPEGYFERPADTERRVRQSLAPGASRLSKPLSEESLLERLADPSRYVDADLLLSADYYLDLRQIEDRRIYASVRNLLHELAAPTAKEELPVLATALVNEQKLRSARLLQNVPAALSADKDDREICRGNALLTVGLAHVGEMICALRDGLAPVVSEVAETANGLSDNSGDLHRLKENFGITILLPPNLADNRELCRLLIPN